MGRFRDALATPGLQGIAEVKRRSPSAGDLRPDADPPRLPSRTSRPARRRSRSSSTRVSAARGTTSVPHGPPGRLPLLAKGFFSTEEDLRGACEAGADAALLILRDLDDETRGGCFAPPTTSASTRSSRRTTGGALACGELDAPVIGINARDLATFTIDRRAQLDLVASSPRDRIVVAESGIESRAHGAAAELAEPTQSSSARRSCALPTPRRSSRSFSRVRS